MGLLSLPGRRGQWPTRASAQAVHVGVESIEAGVVRLSEGAGSSYRAVLEVAGVDVPPEDTGAHEALLAAYASFLNGLTFPVQLLVRVVPCDLEAYLGWHEDRTRLVSGAASGGLAREHRVFLRRLAGNQSLTERRCYVIVPSDAGGLATTVWHGAFAEKETPGASGGGGAREIGQEARRPGLAGLFAPFRRRPSHEREAAPDQTASASAHRQLAVRCNEVLRALGRCGLTAHRLDSLALAELYYACWCPELSRVQRLRQQLADYLVPVVRRDQGVGGLSPSGSPTTAPDPRGRPGQSHRAGTTQGQRAGTSADSGPPDAPAAVPGPERSHAPGAPAAGMPGPTPFLQPAGVEHTAAGKGRFRRRRPRFAVSLPPTERNS